LEQPTFASKRHPWLTIQTTAVCGTLFLASHYEFRASHIHIERTKKGIINILYQESYYYPNSNIIQGGISVIAASLIRRIHILGGGISALALPI
jgi:hypothetical protein